MATYDSYKDSGVKWLGQIPSHWEVKSLRNFLKPFSIRNQADKQLLSVTREKGVIIRGAKGDNDNNNVIPEDLSGYKHVLPGDFVINKMKSWQGSYGVSDIEGIVSPAYFTYHLDFPNKRFFSLALRSRVYIPFFMQYSKGIRVDQWDLTPDALKTIPFFLPPSDEQEAIVAYLDKATAEIDSAIEAQQKMIDALNERKQIIITRAVTRGLNPDAPLRDSGIDWLGQIPAHWKVSQLRRISAIKTGKTPPSSTTEYYDNRDIIWYTPGDFPASSIYLGDSERKLDNRASKIITIYPANTVLLVGIGGTLGKVGFTNKSCFSNQQINAIIPKPSYNGKFLAYYLTAIREAIRNSANSATLPILNQDATKRLPVVIMPLNEQDSIVDAIEKEIAPITDSIKICERTISLLQERKQIIINEVVTGKKKVI